MPCNTTPTGCAPTADCPPIPDPILPRCDLALPDGVYPWATVVVEGGCIVELQTGRAPLYQPDSCCATPGAGGGGGEGLDGPPGPPGTPATVTPGQVFSLAPGAQPTVVNVGTASNAILDFGIPRGVPGQDATGISGVTTDVAGIDIENGLVKAVPLTWPPVMLLNGTTDNPLVMVTFTKDADGNAVASITGLQALQDYVDSTAAGLQAQITALTARLDICFPP